MLIFSTNYKQNYNTSNNVECYQIFLTFGVSYFLLMSLSPFLETVFPFSNSIYLNHISLEVAPPPHTNPSVEDNKEFFRSLGLTFQDHGVELDVTGCSKIHLPLIACPSFYTFLIRRSCSCA
jgi:hypothetical protein